MPKKMSDMTPLKVVNEVYGTTMVNESFLLSFIVWTVTVTFPNLMCRASELAPLVLVGVSVTLVKGFPFLTG